MRTTMKDVAFHAGVSVATVSHVINNSNIVKEETKQKVLFVIKELHYTPDFTARTFKTGKRNMIGFILPDIRSNFYASIIADVEDNLAQKGFKLIVANSHGDAVKELELIQLMSSGLVDGLMFTPSHLSDYDQVKASLAKKDFPLIFLGREEKNCPFDSVVISDYNPTVNAMQYLIEHGHKKIGYLAAVNKFSPLVERRRAYEDTMEHYKIPYDETMMKYVNGHAFQSIKELLETGCTALLASTNTITSDAFIYFLNHEISLVSDVTLVGYLNDGSTSDELKNLVQILHPVNEMGILAVNQLLKRMKTPNLPIKNIVLMGHFVPPEKDRH